MSKAILISIKPKWCELIASGKKTVEVRKTKPKLETPFKVYIYATEPRSKKDLGLCLDNGKVGLVYRWNYDYARKHKMPILSGKVIGEFVCDSIDQYDYDYCPHPEIGMDYDCGDSWWEIADEDLENACLTYEDFKKYAWRQKVMFGWHISDLVIYDKPKELSELKKINRECWYADLGLAKRDCPECQNKGCFVQRPPQSWCYVEGGGSDA